VDRHVRSSSAGLAHTWLSVLAQAAAPHVPAAVHARRSHATASSLPSAKPAQAVETTNALQGQEAGPQASDGRVEKQRRVPWLV
jgi:hypothetical protein